MHATPAGTVSVIPTIYPAVVTFYLNNKLVLLMLCSKIGHYGSTDMVNGSLKSYRQTSGLFHYLTSAQLDEPYTAVCLDIPQLADTVVNKLQKTQEKN